MNIFREYDIRGVVGDELTPELAFSLGRAFGALLLEKNPSAKEVSVGRDVRLSSDELAAGLVEGILSSGLHVCDIGVCPTPVQYFSIFHLGLDGGIMVTGSHNPAEYNGFKLSIGKQTIHGKDIQTLREIMSSDAGSRLASHVSSFRRFDILGAYRDYMLNEFSFLAGPEYRRPKVVVDAGNGTAGLVVPEILDAVGCDVIPLFCEPDGRFPNHHPDPTVVEYIRDLISTTKESGADFGVGYDGDSDRIGVVDSDGEVVWGDQIMIVLSREMLKSRPGAKVIGDVKCSQRMFDDIARHGGVPIMWKTGHSLIKQKMKDEGALMAGEFSGHIFIGDRYYGYDDAIYTTLRLVEIMKTTGKDIKTLLADVPKMCHTPEIRVDCPDESKRKTVEEFVNRFVGYRENSSYGGPPIKDLDTTDGVRVVFEKGWGLARTSNTQPVIVMRFEAEDKESLAEYKEFFEKELKKAMSDKKDSNEQ